MAKPKPKAQLAIDWAEEAEALYYLLLPELLTAEQIGSTATLLDLAKQGLPMAHLDWAQANETAAAWAEKYTFDLVKGINDTTREQLQQAIGAFNRTPGMTRGQLEQLIMQGPGGIEGLEVGGRFYSATQRAEMIAVTEVTRAYSAGEVNAMQATGVEYAEPMQQPPAHVGCRCSISWMPRKDGTMGPRWNTLRDERVCPVCGGLDGKDVGRDADASRH